MFTRGLNGKSLPILFRRCISADLGAAIRGVGVVFAAAWCAVTWLECATRLMVLRHGVPCSDDIDFTSKSYCSLHTSTDGVATWRHADPANSAQCQRVARRRSVSSCGPSITLNQRITLFRYHCLFGVSRICTPVTYEIVDCSRICLALSRPAWPATTATSSPWTNNRIDRSSL